MFSVQWHHPIAAPSPGRGPDGVTRCMVGEGALSSALPELEDWLARRTAFLVTTPRVLALHGDRLDVLAARRRSG